MKWTVKIARNAKKQMRKLPNKLQKTVDFLVRDITANGPERVQWFHYGSLRDRPGYHHCHLNKGKPRYVAVWKESENEVHLIEVRYVGTHEKADYKKII